MRFRKYGQLINAKYGFTRLYALVLVLALSLGLFSSAVHAQSTKVPQVFTVQSNQPVVPHGIAGSWNAIYTDPGAVLYYDGQFHMFYNGFNGWPASVQIGYATSSDGVTWTREGSDPVLMTSQVSFAKIAALASGALVQPDGTWVLYFYTWDSLGTLKTAPGTIGRATAPKPRGPWTVDATPVLKPGGGGTWDSTRVDSPAVFKTEKGYIMYYAGTDSHGVQRIGLATSTDGITWMKYKDPSASSDPLYAESSPVLRPGDSGQWDSERVQQPKIQQTPDGWVMVYRTVQYGKPSTIRLGVATSKDGITWTKSAQNPVFAPSSALGSHGYWYTGLLYHDDIFYLYIEAQPGVQAESEVFLALHEGSLT